MVGVLGSEILAGAAAAAMLFDFRMALQVVGQAVGDDRPLLHHIQPLWLVLVDFVDEQGVVSASQNDRVDVGALVHELIDVFLDEVVGTVAIALAVLDQWHPHGACMAVYLEIWVHPLNFNVIAAAGNRARGAEHADVARVGQFPHLFHGWPDDAQHTSFGRQCGQVLLLDRAQGLGRGRITCQDYQVASLCEQVLDSLQGEFIDQLT